MGNCFPKLRGKKEKSVSEILSISPCTRPCCIRTPSPLEDDMVRELNSSALESESSSSFDAELDQISETIQFTEVQDIYIEKPGFSYVLHFNAGRPERMPSRLAERSATRLKVVSSIPKMTEEDERYMDAIVNEVEETERLEQELKEKQDQAMALRQGHLNAIRQKAISMRMKAKHRRLGHGDGRDED